ncbi:hypothetical protein KEM60_01256 [Austwickia sp. TVS 96-490-7B]|uniref:GNAT family N-acetyltransferase n=1 Tax=Austwickia sp. TVS 96-490-7B TaxID=2830843 RepID=UPI001C56C431|nr:GNAT family N-acetyltransferase [Austwickia sp. TVS 96-490-7B]MBW3085064.1 hypothetical protein [Austwickia sp. TVS 96-490-7B]
MTLATEFTVTTDLDRIDLDTVHHWLSTDTFWATGRSREIMQRAAENSLNFGVLDTDGALCGYARVVTDQATFAWLCDVYVPSSHRGLGLGLLLSQKVVDTLAPWHLKRIMLTTIDAHSLYEKVGFTPFPNPKNLMWITAPE